MEYRFFKIMINYICAYELLQTFSYVLRLVSHNALFCGSPAGCQPLRSFS